MTTRPLRNPLQSRADPVRLFDGVAQIYAHYRPGYPHEAAVFLADRLRLDERSVVADVGSGTGLFSRCLLDAGLRVIGVEPNDEMRQEAEARHAGHPRFSSRRGWAEATGLPDGCVDLVTAAQSFHWFDKIKFREECRRLLRPEGAVAIVWNRRDPDTALHRALNTLCRTRCPGFEALEFGIPSSQTAYPSFFRDGAFVRRTFHNDLLWGWPDFVGRTLSSSFAPRMGTPDYKPLLDALRNLFDQYSIEGKLRIKNETLVVLGNV